MNTLNIWPERYLVLDPSLARQGRTAEPLSEDQVYQVLAALGPCKGNVLQAPVYLNDETRLLAMLLIGEDFGGGNVLYVCVTHEHGRGFSRLRLAVISRQPSMAYQGTMDSPLMPDTAAAMLDGMVARLRAIPGLGH
jgi:hypothetical protein